MSGHVRINGQWFPLVGNTWSQSVADTMAPKTSQGAPSYADDTAWDYFVQTSWAGGVKGAKAEGDTYLTSDMATWSQSSGLGFLETGLQSPSVLHMGNLDDWTIRVGGDDSTYDELSVRATNRDTAVLNTDMRSATVEFWVVNDGYTTPIDIFLYDSVAGPDSERVWTGGIMKHISIMLRPYPGLQKVAVCLHNTDGSTMGTTANPVIRILPAREVRFVVADTQDGSTVAALPNGLANTVAGNYVTVPSGLQDGLKLHIRATANYALHAETAGTFPWEFYWLQEYSSYSGMIYYTPVSKKHLGITDDYWYLMPDALGYTGNTPDAGLTTKGALSATPTDVAGDGEYVWVGHDAAAVVRKIGTTAGTAAATAYYAQLLEVGGGYLWRYYDGVLYYSADESSWTSVSVGTAAREPVDIVFYDGNLLYVTSRGLYAVAAGDIIVPVAIFDEEFTSYDGAVKWNDAVYFAFDGGVLEYNGAALRPVFPSTNFALRGLFGDIQVRAFRAGATELEMVAVSEASDQYATAKRDLILLAYDGSSVHVKAVVHGAYDTYVNKTPGWLVSGLLQETGNPERKTAWDWSRDTLRGYTGSIVTNWVSGSLEDVNKDWDSVTLFSSQFGSNSTTGYYAVWYQADGDWVYAGQAYLNEQVKFLDTLRPLSKRIRFAFVVHVNATYDYDIIGRGLLQPRVDSMRVKYHAMTRDRWRWSIAVPCYDGMLLPDGSRANVTEKELRDHVASVAKTQAPFEYIDVTGDTYWVKVTSCQGSLEYIESDYEDNLRLSTVWRMSLEEIDPTGLQSRAVSRVFNSTLLDEGLAWGDGEAGV